MNNFFEQKPKEGYGFIYEYISPSNKKYIGQTIRSLKERAKNNGNGYLNCVIFFRAIQKYGFENFQCKILGEFKIEELDEKERFFIEKEKSIQPYGYNIKPGGSNKYQNSKRCKYINQFDLNGNFIKQYKSLMEAANDNNTQYQAISAVLNKKRKQHNGYIYRYDTEKNPEPIQIKKTYGIKTAQYDLNGNLIAVYNSANQAGIAVGGNGRNIRLVCSGKRQTAYGFKWKYLD